MNDKTTEEVLSSINENLVLDVSGALYLKFPENFKGEFDIKSACPILATLVREKKTTKLCFVFSNDTLKHKK